MIILRIFIWLKTLALFLVLATAAGYFVYNSDWFQRKVIYPFPYRGIVFEYAEKNDLDPHLVAAIMHTESKFVSTARSPKGAIGLMQMMPETGQWVAGQLKISGFTESMLYEPEVNVRFGTWYMSSLKQEFDDNEILALAAYNAGRGNVKQWMRQFDWKMDFADIDQIPYRETKDYVKRVLHAKKRYSDLYGQ